MSPYQPYRRYTVSLVLFEESPDGSGKAQVVEEVLDTRDYGAAAKLVARLKREAKLYIQSEHTVVRRIAEE